MTPRDEPFEVLDLVIDVLEASTPTPTPGDLTPADRERLTAVALHTGETPSAALARLRTENIVELKAARTERIRHGAIIAEARDRHWT
ncbi:hypothetical protein [Agromyces archimandritae]|uniref:Uncharacterized protein n=1 Tax=Agromyces archimandritae TaxID=2781962 RepID=A0A975FP13_9MICO|nr:hypothetical protein [Agromyces archimandritae]QTX04546.1 hypothetical protein G127AT_14995 [Agromyces archimandritae]